MGTFGQLNLHDLLALELGWSCVYNKGSHYSFSLKILEFLQELSSANLNLVLM